MKFSNSTKRTLLALFQIFLILFGIYIFIQIMIKVFGGSWDAENLVISLLMCSLGLLFSLVFFFARMYEDFKHHKRQFRALASDFKRTDKNVERILMRLG